MSKEPDLVAQMDQAAAQLEQVGRTQALYFRTLIVGGYERAEAMQLVLNHQEAMLYPPNPNDD